MTEFAQHLSWLSLEAFDGVIWLWYVSALILLLFVSAIAWHVKTKLALSRSIKWLIPLMVAGCVGILLMATAWHWNIESGYHPEQTATPLSILDAFACISFLSCALCVAFSRGQRLVAAAIALPGLWYGFWCFFVATMSISGVWL